MLTPTQIVAQAGGAYVKDKPEPEMVEEPKERIIIALLERHYCSLSTLEQEIANLEVKLEPVTKESGIRREVSATKDPPPVPDGWNDDSSRMTRTIGEMGQRIMALSGRIAALTEYLET